MSSHLVPVAIGIAPIDQPGGGKPKLQDNQKILPGYQHGGKMWLGDVVEEAQRRINGKRFQVVAVDTNYTCSDATGLQLDGNGIHVTLKPLE